MNKKIILQIISIIMALSVIFTVGGCKNSGDDDGIVNAKGNPVQPSVNEEDQAIIKYTTVNADGKEEEATKVLDVNSPIVNEVDLGEALDKQYKTDDQKNNFIDRAESSGISKDDAEDIINNASEWVDFAYTVYIANTSAKFMHTRQITVANENENIILQTNLDAEYGINSGTGFPIYICGYVNSAKFADEESLIAELNKMGIKLIYTFTDDNTTDIDNWDEVTTETMDIKF